MFSPVTSSQERKMNEEIDAKARKLPLNKRKWTPKLEKLKLKLEPAKWELVL